ncbi:MAG: hypothetical protein C0423_01805 [Methylibium sp.]|nr:hypothetical protein [Methylibium sp.]
MAPWAYLVLNGSSMGLIDSRALPAVSMLPPDLEALISGTTLSAINSTVSVSTFSCTAEVNRMMAAGELSPQTSGGVSGSTAGLSWSCSIGMDSATMMPSWHVLISP